MARRVPSVAPGEDCTPELFGALPILRLQKLAHRPPARGEVEDVVDGLPLAEKPQLAAELVALETHDAEVPQDEFRQVLAQVAEEKQAKDRHDLETKRPDDLDPRPHPGGDRRRVDPVQGCQDLRPAGGSGRRGDVVEIRGELEQLSPKQQGEELFRRGVGGVVGEARGAELGEGVVEIGDLVVGEAVATQKRALARDEAHVKPPRGEGERLEALEKRALGVAEKGGVVLGDGVEEGREIVEVVALGEGRFGSDRLLEGLAVGHGT